MDITFDSPLVTFDGALVALVLPDQVDVRTGVQYGPSGADYTGALIVGGAYPTPAEISAAVLSALNATAIPVDVKKVNGVTLQGAGVTGNSMRPA